MKSLQPVQEQNIYLLAYQKGGQITLADIVSATSLDGDQADALMNSMVINGYANMQVMDSGTIIYTFNNLHQLVIKTSEPITIKGITFRVTQCEKITDVKRKQTWITCSLLITSRKDLELTLYADGISERSRVIDNEGHEYRAKQVAFGQQSSRFVMAEATLTRHIPMKAVLYFEADDISPSVSSLVLLEVFCKYRFKTFKIMIKNIPLSKCNGGVS